jgi:hypothetical protein
MNRFAILVAAFALAACSSGDNGVQVTAVQPAPKPVAPGRTEPIFYNGKTYSLKFTPADNGGYFVAISGMSSAQQNDATGLTTSAFHHYYCKDSQRTRILASPSYADSKWNSVTQCG